MVSYLLCPCCMVSKSYYQPQTSKQRQMVSLANPAPPHSTYLPELNLGESDSETPRSPFSGRSDSSRLEGVTQVHAAAVNGDKQTLARLLAGGQDLEVGDQFGRSPLMYCVLADRLECAEILLKAGALVNLKDRGGRTTLHWAAHKGNLRFMKLLLSRGADCREKDNEGQAALHLVTRHKMAKCMALLLRQLTPGEVDDQDNNKRTALHWASSHGNLEHVKMLIKQGSNIGIPDTEGKTPLHWAASTTDADAVSCVLLILETSPSVINWQDYEGRTALHLAVADGNQSVVSMLTSVENVNVSALDNVFRTPLHWAAVLGHPKIVAVLLKSGADSSASDSNGATALHYAAQNNFSTTVSVFLDHACTDEADLEGRTAFMWAAGKGADDVIQVFLAHRVDVHQEDKTGDTALHASALSGHSSTVKLLLNSGARLEQMDQAKHTPLFRACEMGQMDVVQTLIEYRARVDILDTDGRSPLHWAALGGHAYICQMLVKYGVHPNIRDNSARTPLHCAAYGGFVNCMSALMEHGAEPNSQDKEGMTCLHWACSKGHLDAVKLLIEYSAYPNHMEFTEDRYTPLDYALMGEHHEVAQYMIEQGALSITGIQDIAALKIQSAFKGFRVRRAFIERKKLLMKHEKLKKEAARKRAAEEGKKSEDQTVYKHERLDKIEEGSTLSITASELEEILPSKQIANKENEEQDIFNKDQHLQSDLHDDMPQFELEQINETKHVENMLQNGDLDSNDTHVSCDSRSKSKEIDTTHTAKEPSVDQETQAEFSSLSVSDQDSGASTLSMCSISSRERQSSPTSYKLQNREILEKIITKETSENQSKNQFPEDLYENDVDESVSQLDIHSDSRQHRNRSHSSKSRQTKHVSLSYAQLQMQNNSIQRQLLDPSIKLQANSRPKSALVRQHKPRQQRMYLLDTQLPNMRPQRRPQQLSMPPPTIIQPSCPQPKQRPSPSQRQKYQKQNKDHMSITFNHRPTRSADPRLKSSVKQRATTPRGASPRSPKKYEHVNNSFDVRPGHMTPEDQSSKPKFMQSILKRPAEPTENEKILATRSQAQQVKLQERERQQAYQMKMEAARRIQRCWRNYYNSKKTRQMMSKINELSTENIRRKRLRATQEEWETQIAALTIQLAWRKYYRKKLLSTLHPNRRQLLMWDPEVVALKQQALVNYIYNEHIYAPFWHPTLKVANRPLWHRFIPSSAAVSYNFAVDQYVPWVARIGAQPQMPSSDLPLTPAGVGGFPRGMSQNSSRASSVRSSKTRSEISLETEKRNPNSSKKTTNAMRKS